MQSYEAVHSHSTGAEVAEIVQRLWAESGEPAEVVSEEFVILPRLGRVECVFDAIGTLRNSRTTLTKLLDQGLDVLILVPIRLLGTAHEEVRDMNIALQGWIEGDTGIPRFVFPEQA
ncbi:hypothetical protein [Nocardia noduli]|uniref:hypothetical protein n=1 Tax=Nocardia noduli TaxID=2815722 RepID=UPI001C21C602|nr:hypothetical protein [Nocardia noduli]